MGRPLITTRTISKWDWIILTLVEEISQIVRYGDSMELVKVNEWIKNSFYSWNGIHNDNNMFYVLYLSCSINATSNGKKLSFNWQNIHCIVNSFSDITCLSSLQIVDLVPLYFIFFIFIFILFYFSIFYF